MMPWGAPCPLELLLSLGPFEPCYVLPCCPLASRCLASAHGDVLVDQTPGRSQPACAILCIKPPVSPLQAAIAECCDRNSDP
jgi:hypothetical protein